MLPIIWSKTANRQYAFIIEGLSKKALDTANKLDESTEKMLRQIIANPLSFPTTEINQGCRRCEFTSHYSLVYEVRDECAYIVSYLDNSRP